VIVLDRVVDTRPLRAHPDFRRLWFGTTASTFSGQVALVAVLFQVWDLTHSSVWVGLIGVAEGVPMIAFGLLGGTLADRVDRRALVLVTSSGAAVAAGLLALQAALDLRLLGVVLVLVGRRLLTLPFTVGSWQLRRDVGLSTQSVGGLARDAATGFAVDTVVTAALVLLVVGLGRRSPARWTLVAGPVAAAAVLVGSLAYPLVVEPLSNDFTPLAEGKLRDRIEAVAAAEGVHVDDVVVADASRRTTTLNAWVSGMGPTRRVVLYDNLVEDVDPDEVLVIVAHELAHARHGDVLVGTTVGAAGAVAGVGLLGWLLALPRVLRRGSGAGSVAGVPLVLALLAVGTQLSAPVQNGVSRHLERRADVTSLEMTADPGAFVEVQVELARRSLADPTPPALSQWWWGSHPGVLERVTLARGRATH